MFARMMRVTMLVLAASAVQVSGSMAGSTTTLNGNDPQTLRRLGNQADIDILNSIRGRERFQLEQRWQREEDRQMNQRREPLPRVPQFRPGCLDVGQSCS